jgi:hypothetical protein
MSMRKLLESWQRTLEQDEFKISEIEVLNEVNIFELGLPAGIAESIDSEMKDSSREAKVKVGQMWKNTRLSPRGSVWSQQIKGLREMVAGFINAVETTSLEYRRKHGLLDQDALEDPERSKAYQELSDKAGIIASNYKNTFNYATGADFMKAEKMAQRFFKKGINGTLPQAKFKSDHEDLFEKSVSWLADSLTENYAPLFEYLNTDEHGNHLKMVKDKTFLQSALEIAVHELAGREDPDKIVHEYNDGYYWYDIGATSCEIEAEKMQHCGADSRATTLYSLRSPNNDPNVKFNRDHWVTVAYDENNKVAYQIKGVDNGVPEERHFKKILDLLKSVGVERIEERGQYTNNKDAFNKVINYFNKELGLEENTKEVMKKELMQFVNKYQEEYTYRTGISIGFKLIEDEDGIIRYIPKASFAAEFYGEILSDHGEKTIKKDGTNFGQNVAIRLADSEKYKYAPDNYKTIENFYRKDVDFETNPDIGGTGAITGQANGAHVYGSSSRFSRKLVVWTPIDAPKVLGNPVWAYDGSAAIPNNREDSESYATFYDEMVRVGMANSENMKEAIRIAMLDANYIEGAMFQDIADSITNKEFYTRGTLPPDTEPSSYRDFPTDWELDRAIDEESDTLENITATMPTITLNIAALLDEHDIPSVPGGLAGIKALFNFNVFGAELMKEMLKEAGSETEYERGEAPNQLYLFPTNPYESRPYVFAIDWALQIEPDTKDSIAKDFLHIVSKIDTKDKITDVAEKAFINMMKKKFPEEKLDEATIRMWKRAIL